jgi:predicted secreted protein
MNKPMRRLGWGVLIALLPLSLAAQARERKDPVGILPLAGEHQEMAKRFQRGIVDATAALEKYYPWAVEESLFQIAGLEIPTDMPPRPDLIPGARYALSGGVYMGIRAREYYLQLWLWDMNGPSMIYTDDLVYGDMEEAMASLPGLVAWLFSHIHEQVVEVPAPLLKPDPLFTLGFRLGPSQRWYTDPVEISPGANALTVEGGLTGALRLNSLLSLQAEILFAPEFLVYRGLNYMGNNIWVLVSEKFNTYSLMFPLVFKLNFRPGLFRVSPMAGIFAAVPLGRVRYTLSTGGEADYSWSFSLPLGFTVGLEGARKYGPGALLAGLRYSRGFGHVEIKDRGGTKYSRDMLSVYLGYEFGFMDRNKK